MAVVHPIFVEGAVFEPKVTRAMSIAFEEICLAMNLAPNASGQRQAIAIRVIELVRRGERNPYLLRDQVLSEVQRLQ